MKNRIFSGSRSLRFSLIVAMVCPFLSSVSAHATPQTWSSPGASQIAWKLSADSIGQGSPDIRFDATSVTFGNGLFVAVSGNYQTDTAVETSVDGNIWIPRTADTATQWNSVAYGAGLFVAVGRSSTSDDGVAMSSPDGITWSPVSLPANETSWSSIIFANGRFVAVGQDFNAQLGYWSMYSDDGINWSLGNGGVDSYWSSVTYGGGVFVAVGQNGTSGVTNCVMTSIDGVSWTAKVTPNDSFWSGVTYGNGMFLAVSQGGIMRSTDGGDTWSLTGNQNDEIWGKAIFANGEFIISGYGNYTGELAVSSDGFTWEYQDIPSDRSTAAMAFGNSKLVLVFPSGKKMYSNLTRSVVTYSLILTSNDYLTDQPYASVCDSCTVQVRVELARTDGGLISGNATYQVELTYSGTDAALRFPYATNPNSPSLESLNWGSVDFNVQGPGNGSSIGDTITFHAELTSVPGVEGEISIPFVANDANPTISVTSGAGGVYLGITPANPSLPEAWNMYLTDLSNSNPSECVIDTSDPLRIYPEGGSPYTEQDGGENTWYDYQATPNYWAISALKDQNGIPRRLFLPGLVDGCSYQLDLTSYRQSYESSPVSLQFTYTNSPDTFLIHNQTELEAITQQIIGAPGTNFVLSNSFTVTAPTSGSYYVSGDFSGNLNGNGFTISGLTVPLLEKIGDGDTGDIGNVRNLKLVSSTVGVVGNGILTPDLTVGTVSNVHVKGKIKVNSGGASGGLIGQTSTSTIIETSTASIEMFISRHMDTSSDLQIGGLVGSHMGTITSSASSGDIISAVGNACMDQNQCTVPTRDFGGLVGRASTQGAVIIENSHSSVDIYVDKQYASYVGSIGGFAGTADNTTISRSLSTGLIKSKVDIAGGFIGLSRSGSTTSSSVSSGAITNMGTEVTDFIDSIDSDSSISSSSVVTVDSLKSSGVSQLNDGQNIWAIDPTINYGLPYILALEPSGFYARQPKSEFSPHFTASVSFASTLVGQSQDQDLVITITEAHDDGMGFITWSVNEGNPDFQLIENANSCDGSELGTDNVCNIGIRFAPTSAGEKSAVLGAITNSIAGSFYEYVTIRATATVNSPPAPPSPPAQEPSTTPIPIVTGNVQPTAKMVKVKTVYLATGSYLLNSATKSALRVLAQQIKSSGKDTVLAYGYADIRGGMNNTLLSKLRAKAVAEFLRPLLKGKKIVIGWYGSKNPAVRGKLAKDLAMNRRVEIFTK